MDILYRYIHFLGLVLVSGTLMALLLFIPLLAVLMARGVGLR